VAKFAGATSLRLHSVDRARADVIYACYRCRMHGFALDRNTHSTIRNNRNNRDSFFELIFFEKTVKMQGCIIGDVYSFLNVRGWDSVFCPTTVVPTPPVEPRQIKL
jgi:hypothetical protein